MIAFGRIAGKRDCKYNTVNKTDFDWIIMHLSNNLFTENVCYAWGIAESCDHKIGPKSI